MIAVSIVRNNKSEIADKKNDDTNIQQAVMEEDADGKKYLEGSLYKSEDLSRGNFKLSSDEGDIYIRTSRDFSALIGLQVLVRIDGTKDNFELLDIESKVAKDGFLIQQ